jgi:multiple sugar transport system substrate-binding protein
MKLKLLIILFIVSIICSSITGCKKEQDSKVPLRLIVWGDPKSAKVFDKLVVDFNKQNPDINLTCEYCPWTRYPDKILTLVAGGKQPDVARMSYRFYVQCAEAGIVDPLDDFMKTDKTLNLSDFYKPSLDG